MSNYDLKAEANRLQSQLNDIQRANNQLRSEINAAVQSVNQADRDLQDYNQRIRDVLDSAVGKINNSVNRALDAYELQGQIDRLYVQFKNMELANKTYPAMWLRREPGGGVEMYGGGYRRQFPKHVEEDTGFKEVVWGMLDAFQPGCLDFLVDRYMKVIDKYEPWALGWDCAGFDPSDFLVVSTITQKIRDKKLPTKVVGNECSGPITAYLDWTMIENGTAPDAPPPNSNVPPSMVTCLKTELFIPAAAIDVIERSPSETKIPMLRRLFTEPR